MSNMRGLMIVGDFVIENGVLVRYGGEESDIVIPDGVKIIGERAFMNCRHIKSVVIPNGVTRIDDLAFSNCCNLTSITISDSINDIGDYVFEKDISLTSIVVAEGNEKYSSVDGVLFNKDKTVLIYYPNGREGAYCIPNGVTGIDYDAFSDCCNLTSITIPDSIIDIVSFEKDIRLTSIAVAEGNEKYSSVDGVLFNKEKTVLIYYPSGREGAYCIPDSVTYIDEFAFAYSINLADLTIPDSVTRIGECAFWVCRNLESITIPSSVTHIGEGAFIGNPYLENIIIQGRETTIGPGAFRDCIYLTIHAPVDSFAQYYAAKTGIKFKTIS